MSRHELWARLWRWIAAFGLDLHVLRGALGALPSVLRDYRQFQQQNNQHGARYAVSLNYPLLVDKGKTAGLANPQYFYQDYMIARKIYLRSPERHVDVGSSIEGFVAHVAVFRPVEVFDIRPLTTSIPNIVFRQCDFMQPPAELTGYCDSLSCLHVLEHFGLGRYGDPVDIHGHLKGFAGLRRVLQPGGTLYLSVPISHRERVEFNAHRIFSIQTILEMAQEQFDLVCFSYVDDSGNLHEAAASRAGEIDPHLELEYGLGIFEFRKRA